jgi:outer membrane protein
MIQGSATEKQAQATRYGGFKTPISLTLFLFILFSADGQSILEKYIKQGLDSNLALKQKTFDLKKAQLDLDRAKTLFYPHADFNAQYTLATGGRTQDIPIGDLLNNVYTTLNSLTSTNKFPQVQNQAINFLPNNFQDTKVEVTMPLYNPEIKYNRDIKAEIINANIAEVNLYKRELVKNIKEAYYDYLQASKSVEIYTNALAVVNENLRVNEKLVKNTMATQDVVLKAKAQVSAVQTSLTGALQILKNAVAYFNFLLNQPLETAIENDPAIFQPLDKKIDLSLNVPANREELLQIKSGQEALSTNLKLNRSYKLPRLNAFYDVGFQGFGYKFFDNQFYQIGGLQLTWNIFKANDNKLKIKQTQLDMDALQNQYINAEKQVQLQIATTYNSYVSALQALQSSNDEVINTKEAYRLTDRKYREGQALQIELTQARIDMTTAEIKYSLAQLAVLNKAAELERVMATYPIQ